MKAAAFTRAVCPDGKPVGNNGAARGLGVDRRRVIDWVSEEENMTGKMKSYPGKSTSQSLNPGNVASTVDIEQQQLEDYINEQSTPRLWKQGGREQVARVKA